MVSASVGFQCPDCVSGRTPAPAGATRAAGTAMRPGGGGFRPPARPADNRPRNVAGGLLSSGDPKLVTKILIGINIAVFIAIYANGQLATDLALVGQFVDGQGKLGGVADGQWYRLVTSIFDHQQIWHIGFNMLSLWWIGGPLEALIGRLRYIALYALAGLAGSALTFVVAPDSFSLGASGAIFGLFGATAVFVRRLRYDIRPVIGLLAVNLIITFVVPDIAWQAHIGGLVAGGLLAIAMAYGPQKYRTVVQIGACVLMAAVIVVMVLVETAQLTG
jgi:membrane associated rhomboid family serine protease